MILLCLQNQYYLENHYTLLSLAASARSSLDCLWTRAAALTLRKDFLEDFASLMLVASSLQLISQPQLTSFYFLRKQKFHFNGSKFKTSNGSVGVLDGLSNFPLKLPGAGLHCLPFSPQS